MGKHGKGGGVTLGSTNLSRHPQVLTETAYLTRGFYIKMRQQRSSRIPQKEKTFQIEFPKLDIDKLTVDTSIMAAVKVKLPDFVETWPWQRELNPHYEEAKREANEWAHSFGFFDAKSQDAFDRCEFGKFTRTTQQA